MFFFFPCTEHWEEFSPVFVCRSCGEKKTSQPAREGTELVTGMYTNLMSAHAGEHNILGRESLLSQTSKKLASFHLFSQRRQIFIKLGLVWRLDMICV